MTRERIRALFNQVVVLPQPERDSFLQKACGNDEALKREVEALLVHDSVDPTGTSSMVPGGLDPERREGSMIGSFKVLSTLGEGGMGVVYLAEQTEPVRRKVALKVIKAGMDTKQVVARFEAERQALAIMSHPGIAQVYEAGTTVDGRPYFVMEYVKGQPVTDACDVNLLDTTERLQLMREVCEAVQHAHQKGVIHRDLKPSNILVVRGDDDTLHPKIIDFGIAKATGQQLTDMTLVTQVGHFIGTPAYMSPEQADLNVSDIDTRSDVYSLGVVLYEVLSGRPPFAPETLRAAGLEEMRRIIREDAPPRPSTQLETTAGKEAAMIARSRQTELPSLTSVLRRELEWIPLKALRKHRSERYDSALMMAEDIRRYLEGEPLEAGPESMSYRFKKTLRRNKGPFIAAAVIALILVAGVVASLVFAFAAERERLRAQEQATLATQEREDAIKARDEAEAEKNRADAVKVFVTTMLASVDPETAGEMDKELMTLVLSDAAASVGEQFADQPLIEAELRTVIGSTYMGLGMYDEAEFHINRSKELFDQCLGEEHELTLKGRVLQGEILLRQGRLHDSRDILGATVVKIYRLLGEQHELILHPLEMLKCVEEDIYGGEVGRSTLDYGFEEAIYAGPKIDRSKYPWLASEQASRFPEVHGRISDNSSSETQERLHGSTQIRLPHPIDQWTYEENYFSNQPYLAHSHLPSRNQKREWRESKTGRTTSITRESFKPQSEALKKRKRTLGDAHPEIIDLIVELYALHWLVDLDISKNEDLVRDALNAARITYGDTDPRTLVIMCDLGIVLREQDRHDESRELLQTVLNERSQLWGNTDRRTLRVLEELIQAHHFAGDHAAAKSVFDVWLSNSDATLGEEEVATLNKLLIIADALIEREQYEQAERYCRLAYQRIRIVQPEYPTSTSVTGIGITVWKRFHHQLGWSYIPMKLALVLEKQEKYASLEPILNDIAIFECASGIKGKKRAVLHIRRLVEVLDAQGKRGEADEQRLRANRLAQDIVDEERAARLREEDLAHRRSLGLFPYAHQEHEGEWIDELVDLWGDYDDMGRRFEALSFEQDFAQDADLALYDKDYARAEENYLLALSASEIAMGPRHPHHLGNIASIIRLYESWHEAEPDAGHDSRAAEYRALLQVTDTTDD
jgi:serine/threonine protein kinase